VTQLKQQNKKGDILQHIATMSTCC